MEDQRQTHRRADDLKDWRITQLEERYSRLQTGVDEINGKLSIIGSMQTAHSELVRQVEACRADHLNGDRELWKRVNDHGKDISDHAKQLATVEQAERSSSRVSWLILAAIIGQAVLIFLRG